MNPDSTTSIVVLTLLCTFIGLAAIALIYTLGQSAGRADRRCDDGPAAPADAALFPDPLAMEAITQAEAHLESLPHFRRLSDGTLIDLLSGAILAPCTCRPGVHPHRRLRYGERNTIILARQSALAKYVALQDRIAAALPHGERS